MAGDSGQCRAGLILPQRGWKMVECPGFIYGVADVKNSPPPELMMGVGGGSRAGVLCFPGIQASGS